MCTILLYKNSHGHSPYSLIIGANRDENPMRPSLSPAAHWPDHPDIFAGQDLASPSKGSWLGLNRQGVVSALVAQAGTLGMQNGKQSRGNLVIKALSYPDAKTAHRTICDECNPSDYRGFYLLIADRKNVFIVSPAQNGMQTTDLPDGYHLVTPEGVIRNAHGCPFIPLSDTDENWDGWIDALNRYRAAPSPDHSSQTVSSALVTLGNGQNLRQLFLYADGGPDTNNFINIDTAS